MAVTRIEKEMGLIWVIQVRLSQDQRLTKQSQ
jgi:hypothetical protein